jgi:hypothetical protein
VEDEVIDDAEEDLTMKAQLPGPFFNSFAAPATSQNGLSMASRQSGVDPSPIMAGVMAQLESMQKGQKLLIDKIADLEEEKSATKRTKKKKSKKSKGARREVEFDKSSHGKHALKTAKAFMADPTTLSYLSVTDKAIKAKGKEDEWVKRMMKTHPSWKSGFFTDTRKKINDQRGAFKKTVYALLLKIGRRI